MLGLGQGDEINMVPGQGGDGGRPEAHQRSVIDERSQPWTGQE